MWSSDVNLFGARTGRADWDGKRNEILPYPVCGHPETLSDNGSLVDGVSCVSNDCDQTQTTHVLWEECPRWICCCRVDPRDYSFEKEGASSSTSDSRISEPDLQNS
jgi:hypothetical protein